MSMQDFKIQKIIGEGAYGRAILAKQSNTSDLVVIKEIALSHLSVTEQREAKMEVKILSSLHHPNIIGYKTSFLDKNVLYIVMDYADGGDLFQQIQNAKGNHFNEEQILDWFVEICLALKHIHDRKILHRDIKCQNIFLMKNGMVKMGDFGIAKLLDNTAQLAKTAIGTPYYLSPEICQGKAYNAKSDIWSLGCVLYELCSLTHAFDSKCMNGLVMKILRSKQAPIPYIYSANLRNLVDSLLQKSPSKRPSVNQILRLEFIRARIQNLLGNTLQKIEFSHTVFHGCKGGETPSVIPEQKPQIKQQQPARVSVAPEPKVVHLPANVQPQQKPVPRPHSNPQQPQPAKQINADLKKPVKIPQKKDDLVQKKNQAVLAERATQKALREKREEEKKQKEEEEEKKRKEILEQRRVKEQERRQALIDHEREEKARLLKYQHLEAPFKAQMREPPKGRRSPNEEDASNVRESAKSEEASRPKGRQSRLTFEEKPMTENKQNVCPSEDQSEVKENIESINSETESDNRPSSQEEAETNSKGRKTPKSEEEEEPQKETTTRPQNVRNREKEIKNLSEMIRKRRAEMKKNKASADFIQIGGVNFEPPAETPEPTVVQKHLMEMDSEDSENGANDLVDLAAIAKNIFDHPPTDSDEEPQEKGEEEPSNSFHFNYQGKELNLPGVNGSESLSYRVEALRKFIEQSLGLDLFIQAYRFVTEVSDTLPEETVGVELKKIFNTESDLSFYPLIQQLVVCEESIQNRTSKEQ